MEKLKINSSCDGSKTEMEQFVSHTPLLSAFNIIKLLVLSNLSCLPLNLIMDSGVSDTVLRF